MVRGLNTRRSFVGKECTYEGSAGHAVDGDNRVPRYGRVQVWERTPARSFPAEGMAQHLGVQRYHNQLRLMREHPQGRSAYLRPGRAVDEPAGVVKWRAAKLPSAVEFCPLGRQEESCRSTHVHSRMTVGTQAAPNSLARARLACKFGAVSWTVRSTRTGDKDAVLQVVRAAFSGPRRHGKVEVGIVARTWELGASPRGLDLVAVIDDMVVGHALGAEGRLDGTPALAVAPLCVSPSRQRMGIGCSLMTELLHRADSGGWPLVLVLGDPLYYQRFNFEPSAAWDLLPASGLRRPSFPGSPPATV